MKLLLSLLTVFALSFQLQAQCAVTVSDVFLFCSGDCAGSLTATGTGGNGLTYLWTTGETTQTISGLCAGDYTVSVTDDQNCTAEATATVGEPDPIEVIGSVTDICCHGICNGSVIITPTGGLPQYSYIWSDGNTTSQATNLCAGVYTVTVVDANGCVVAQEFTITGSQEISLSVQDDLIACNEDRLGELFGEVVGGTTPLTYLWSDGQTTALASNLVFGDYTVTVTDANNCSAVGNGSVIGGSPSIDFVVTDDDCDNPGTADVELRIINGTGVESISWSGPGVEVGTANQVDLSPGTYFVTVTDGEECTATDSLVLSARDVIAVTPEVVIGSCEGACQGTASVVVSGGVAPYTYAWPADFGTGPRAVDLCSGDYEVTVTDSYGCTGVTTVFIEELPAPEVVLEVIDVSCGDLCDGEIRATVTGGTPGYTYAWSNGVSTKDLVGLCLFDANTYSVTVTDANGCDAIASASIEGPEPIIINLSQSGGDCDANGGDFSSSLSVIGGVSPYEYLWSNGDTGPEVPEAGPYTFLTLTVTDATGCVGALADVANFSTIRVNQPEELSYQACDNALIYNASLPDGYSQAVITPSGDTLFGSDIGIAELGTYRYLGFSPNNTCLITDDFFLSLADGIIEPDEIFLAEVDSLVCGGFNCLGAFGVLPDNFDLDQFFFLWYGPDGTLIQESFNTEFCGVTQAGVYTLEAIAGCDTVRRSYIVEEPSPCSSVSGIVYYEEFVSCSLDETDVFASEILIRFSDVNSDAVYYTISGVGGEFSLELPVGDYLAEPLVNGVSVADGCEPISVVTSEFTTNEVDFFLPGTLNCPDMEVYVCMWGQRRCFDNDMAINYNNYTLDTVENVQITVELDPFYTFIDASIPLVSLVDNIATFNVGAVPPYQGGFIIIKYNISCEAELGQTHCVRASITPNAICEEVPNWNGALVNIDELTCDSDSLTFRVGNIGAEQMSVPLSYVVVEDGIMMFTNPIEADALEAGGTFELRLPAEGSNYLIRTNQEPNAPVDNDQPAFVIEGCGTDPIDGSNQGFSNFFALGNGVPWEDYVCRQNSGSYDPNDKRGFPLGYNGGQIEPGTRIDYDIRFQNTGTDTAFTVVIQDTLPTSLDLATLKVEGGSHDFTVDLDTNRILTFTFDNIMLPDSNVNLLGSQGMVSFSIDHDPSLEPGDAIDNEAAIYFDFNEPIITNVSHHEIATEELPNSLRAVQARRIIMELFPNPASGMMNIRLPRNESKPGDLLEIRDLYGRIIGVQTFSLSTNSWDVSALAPGYYVMVLTDVAGRAKGRAGFIVSKN